MISELAKLIDSNNVFKKELKTFAKNKNIYSANTTIIIKNILNNKKEEPEILYYEYIDNLRKKDAESQYTNAIDQIEELFGEIVCTP